MTSIPTKAMEPIGWPLLPFPDEHGRLIFPSLAISVRQNLQVILSTRPGEQLMRPDYGAGLTEFLGQADSITTRRRIFDRVTESIARWEPRIDVDRVDVTGKGSELRVDVAYRLRRTGAPGTLGVNISLAA
jgi:phage baseplate assembly protein W